MRKSCWVSSYDTYTEQYPSKQPNAPNGQEEGTNLSSMVRILGYHMHTVDQYHSSDSMEDTVSTKSHASKWTFKIT